MDLPARSRVVLAALILATVAVGDGASAGNSGTQQEQEACTPDVFRLCSAAIPNEDRIVACLKRNESKLSAACRAVFAGPPASEKPRAKR